VIIDCEMQVFPADAATVALPFAVAGDAVTDLLETAEFLMSRRMISPGCSRS